MLLADQGAEIVKVEPLDGDDTRIMGPYHDDDRLRAFGGYFASINRNKKSIAIDLKKPEGRDLVLQPVRRRRCHRREFARRRHGSPRPGLRRPARAVPEAGLCHHPRLRRPAHRQEPLCRLAGLRRGLAGFRRRDGDHRPGQGHADEGRSGDRRPDARHHVRGRHRLGDPARPQDRQGPARRRRHGRCHPVDVRAHRAPALLHRRRAGAGGQPPSPALPVRHVPGQGRPRHPRRPDRCALADPLPPDRQTRDGQRPADSPRYKADAPTRPRSSRRCRTSRIGTPSRNC